VPDATRGEIDWFVPFPGPPSTIGDPKHMRSTWLTASQATLRERGYGPRYEAAIVPEYRDQVLSLVAGVWVPLPVARAHYVAGDALDLPEEELLEIGRAATRRANATHLAFVARLAQGAGVTPWTILGQLHRVWSRTMDGGAVAVQRRGPKEARVLLIGYPLADIRYNRIAMRGIVTGFVELFCERAYVKEIPSHSDARSLGMRLSWA
jgi:hypothetical protein